MKKKKKKMKTTTKPKQAQILVIPDVCLFSKSAIGCFFFDHFERCTNSNIEWFFLFVYFSFLILTIILAGYL